MNYTTNIFGSSEIICDFFFCLYCLFIGAVMPFFDDFFFFHVDSFESIVEVESRSNLMTSLHSQRRRYRHIRPMMVM